MNVVQAIKANPSATMTDLRLALDVDAATCWELVLEAEAAGLIRRNDGPPWRFEVVE